MDALLQIDIEGSCGIICKYKKHMCIDDNITGPNIFYNLKDTQEYRHFDPTGEILNTMELINISFSEIKIGDIIKVSYLPYSQKYIEQYNEQIGRIFFVDYESNNALLYVDKFDEFTNTYTRLISSVEKNYCSYLGDTRGYDIFFGKCIQKRKSS